MHPFKTKYRLITAGLIAVTAAAAIAGHAAAAGTHSTPHRSTLTGSPINIGFYGPLTSPTFSNPDAVKASEVAVAAVNAAGGINGHPLKDYFCDDKGAEGVAAECARTLIDQNHIVAFVGNFSAYNDDLYPLALPKNIVNFGIVGNAPDDVKGDLGYYIHPTSVGYADAAYLVAKKYHATVAANLELAGSGTFETLTDVGFHNAGVKKVVNIDFPFDTADFTPFIEKLKESGAQVWIINAVQAQIAPIITAATALGVKAAFGTCDCIMSNAGLQALATASFPNVIAASFGLNPTEYPVRAEYERELAKYAKGSIGALTNPSDAWAFNNWISTYLFAQVARKLKSVTPTTFHTYLEHQTAFNTGVTHTIDFAAKGPLSQLPNLRNLWTYPATVNKSGEEVQTSSSPFTGLKLTPTGE